MRRCDRSEDRELDVERLGESSIECDEDRVPPNGSRHAKNGTGYLRLAEDHLQSAGAEVLEGETRFLVLEIVSTAAMTLAAER